MYHYLAGGYILRQLRPLCIDNYIILRPVEYGIFVPEIIGDIKEITIANMNNTTVEIQLWRGHEAFRLRYTKRTLVVGTIGYVLTMLNAIIQHYLRFNLDELHFTMMRASSTQSYKAMAWEPYVDGNHPPTPLLTGQLGIVEPGTVVLYDYRLDAYCCPKFSVPIGLRQYFIQQRQLDHIPFVHAGITLTRCADTPVEPGPVRLRGKLMPWQIAQAKPPAYPDGANEPRDMWDYNRRFDRAQYGNPIPDNRIKKITDRMHLEASVINSRNTMLMVTLGTSRSSANLPPEERTRHYERTKPNKVGAPSREKAGVDLRPPELKNNPLVPPDPKTVHDIGTVREAPPVITAETKADSAKKGDELVAIDGPSGSSIVERK